MNHCRWKLLWENLILSRACSLTVGEYQKSSAPTRKKTMVWLNAHPDVKDLAVRLRNEGASYANLTKYLNTYYEFPFSQAALRVALILIGDEQ